MTQGDPGTPTDKKPERSLGPSPQPAESAGTASGDKPSEGFSGEDPEGAQAGAPTAGGSNMSLMEARALAEFGKIRAETQLTELSCERSKVEIVRAQIEIAGLRRRENEAAAEYGSLTYTFYDQVTEESVKACMATLGAWSRRDPTAGITLVFNSPGGSVMDGLALFDYLRHLSTEGHHITTMALGQAASMGSVLLQAGDTRVVGRNTFVMLHQVAAGSIGKSWQIEESIAFIRRLEARLLSLLAERSTMSVPQIKRKWAKTDWWLDAEEAVKLGFADKIR